MRHTGSPHARVVAVAAACLLAACTAESPTQSSAVTPSVPSAGTPPVPAPSPGTGSPASPSSQGGPTVLLSADTICLTTTAGSDPRPDDVRVTMSDGSALSGLTATVAHEAGQPTGWLATSFDRDTTPARLWLRGSVGSLAVGEYLAHVTVTAPGTAPRIVTVILKLHPAGTRALVVKDRSNFFGDLSPGGGRVEGPGIACTSGFGDCVEYFPVGTVVTLTAKTDTTAALFRWTDACEGTPVSSPCTVTISDSTTAGAWFVLRSFTTRLGVAGAGATGGVLVSTSPFAPRYCLLVDGTGGPCQLSGPIDGNKGMALTAEPHFGNRFVGWGGDCTGTQSTCFLGRNPGGSYDVTATFERDPAVGNVLRVTPRAPTLGTLHGTITGGGLDCRLDEGVVSGTCEVTLPLGTTVTLTASADRPVEYSWTWQFQLTAPPSPSCPVSGVPTACTLTLNGPRDLSLSFFAPRSP